MLKLSAGVKASHFSIFFIFQRDRLRSLYNIASDADFAIKVKNVSFNDYIIEKCKNTQICSQHILLVKES